MIRNVQERLLNACMNSKDSDKPAPMCSPARWILLNRQYTEEAIDEEDAAETSYREVELLVQLMAQHEDFRGQNDS